MRFHDPNTPTDPHCRGRAGHHSRDHRSRREEGRDDSPQDWPAVRLRHARHGLQRLDPGLSQESDRLERARRLHGGLLRRHGADDRPPRVALDPRSQRCRTDGRAHTGVFRHRGRCEDLQSSRAYLQRRPVLHALLHRRHPYPGGGRRRAHHAIRHARRRAAPGAPSVEDVLRAVHRRRIVLLDSLARGEDPPRAVHDGADARAADSAAIWRDVLLVVAGPPPRSACSHHRSAFTPITRSHRTSNSSPTSRARK